MQYTENYHLPQWVKSDRIMMQDFNQMCADLEAGMTENAQTAAEVRQSSDALEQQTLLRLRRMAYNQYSAVQDRDPFPWQVGMFHQNPAKDKSNVTGTALWNGVCFTGKGPLGYSPGSLSQYMQQLSPMKIVKGNLSACEPLQVSICIPGEVYMNRISLTGSYSNNVENTPAPARLTLINLDTAQEEVIQTVDIRRSGTNGGVVNGPADAFVTFHSGQHYLLKLEPLAAVYDAVLHFLVSNDTPLYGMVNNNSVTATHTMREHEGSSCGLLIVRGLVFGPNGELKVTWDGQEVPLHTTRMVRIPDGRMVREMAYFRNGPIPAKTSFTLQFNLGEQGAFLFYDWGAVLL